MVINMYLCIIFYFLFSHLAIGLCCMPCCAESRVIKRPNEQWFLQHKDCLVSMGHPHNSVPAIQIWATIQEKNNRQWIAWRKDNWLFVKQLCMRSLWASSLCAQNNAKGIGWGKTIMRKARLYVYTAALPGTTWESAPPSGAGVATYRMLTMLWVRCYAEWLSWGAKGSSKQAG